MTAPHSTAPASGGVYTAKELAGLLGCSVRHVWRMCGTGQLPAPVRIGRLVRWSKQVIEGWLATGTTSR
jgi:excisionase family DNA binding protein